MSDRILIDGLETAARIGVSDGERAVPQRLVMNLALDTDWCGVADDITRTTDYAAVARWVEDACRASDCRLLETLGENLATGLLAEFPRVSAVTIELRKFILPAAQSVGVVLRRDRRR